MKKKLQVREFHRKQNLLEYVNSHSDELEVVSITSSQEVFLYKHFLWYYKN